jgi:CheY-specific phosphatase CheX
MILDALMIQLKLFLTEDMKIDIKEIKRIDHDINNIELKDSTSIIGTGTIMDTTLIMSYDQKVLTKLVETFMEGESIDEDEKDAIYESVSGETINIIVGLALPAFPNRGKDIIITTPTLIHDISEIKKYKNSKIITVEIDTEYGTLSISAIGNKDLIDSNKGK